MNADISPPRRAARPRGAAAHGECGEPDEAPRRRLALLILFAASPLRADPTPPGWGPLTLLGREVPPGQREKLSFALLTSFADGFLDTQIVVLRGRNAGPTLCVVAGLRGDALNGVGIARRVAAETDAQQLAGTLIVVPAANAAGFRSGVRALPDGSDLNRAFPGSTTGSTAARIAQALFTPVIRPCSALVDLDASPARQATLPEVRTDLSDPNARILARAFSATVVLDRRGPVGSLRRAALDAGIAAVSYRAGAPLRFDADEITRGAAGVRQVMAHLGMLAPQPAAPAAIVYRRTRWVRVPEGLGGIFFTSRQPGDAVQTGEVLGTVTDPINDGHVDLTAPLAGRIIAVAVPQVLLPGAAAFQLGYDAEP